MKVHFFILLIVSVVAAAAKNCALIDILEKTLTFGISSQVKDSNFLFGVAIAKGQLDGADTRLGTINDEGIQQKFEILLQRVRYLKNHPLAPQAFSPQLWNLNPPLQSLTLSTPSSLFRPLTDSGLLTPTLSEYCLRSLLLDCALLLSCTPELTDHTTGYPLTHQILFWTLYKQKCSHAMSTKTVDVIIKHKCRNILGENLHIEALGFPLEFQDLYLEQVVVCGMHGFTNFLNTGIQNFLISIQTKKGCFIDNKNSSDCNIHMTGVAIAALSVLIKHNCYGNQTYCDE